MFRREITRDISWDVSKKDVSRHLLQDVLEISHGSKINLILVESKKQRLKIFQRCCDLWERLWIINNDFNDIAQASKRFEHVHDWWSLSIYHNGLKSDLPKTVTCWKFKNMMIEITFSILTLKYQIMEKSIIHLDENIFWVT